MSGLLLESPVKLIALLVAINGILAWVWFARRTPGTRRVLWGGGVAVPRLLAIQHLVVTPREQVVALCHELAELTQAGDINGIKARLANDFASVGLDREAMTESVKQTIARFQPEGARLYRFAFEEAAPKAAVVTFDVTCRIVTAEFGGQRVHSRWRLTVRREADCWRVTRIDALPTPSLPINDLRDLLR